MAQCCAHLHCVMDGLPVGQSLYLFYLRDIRTGYFNSTSYNKCFILCFLGCTESFKIDINGSKLTFWNEP